jgi:hypothetical protein
MNGQADYYKDSDFLLYRQRHEGGNDEMEKQITRHFDMPANAQIKGNERGLDSYLFLSGVQQGRCYQTAVEKWRFGRSTDAQTMGILYWQMNDIW